MTTISPSATEAEVDSPRRSRRTVVVAVLAVLCVAAAAWLLVLKPEGDGEPKPGEVVKLEAIQVNLAGGHYLRLGLALQLVEGAHEIEGSKALDAAIGVFSGRGVGDVNQPEVRENLRTQLATELEERYHGDVLGVYFTEYVTQ